MDAAHLTKEEWIKLEPELAKAERHALEEFFALQPGQGAPDANLTPGALLLQRLLALDDQEGLALFRAAEMLYHELSRHGYAAVYRLGQQSGECAACCEG